jgi:hypothetical protein
MKLFATFFCLGISTLTLASSSTTLKDVPRGQCGPLDPKSLSDICDPIASATLQSECYAVGFNAYLAPCALGACDRFVTDEGAVSCVKSIANREYTLDEILRCDGLTSEDESCQCFLTSGTPIGLGAPK